MSPSTNTSLYYESTVTDMQEPYRSVQPLYGPSRVGPEPLNKSTRLKDGTMNFLRAHENRDRSAAGIRSVAGRLFIRFFQFILGIVVIGLYAQDLVKARKVGSYQDARWVYATVVGTFSSVWALVNFVPRANSIQLLWTVDWAMFLLWVVVFGVFGKMYIHEDPENVGHGDGPGIQRMKNAVWVDLANMLLWFTTAVWGILGCILRRRRTLHTGRAEV